MHLNFYNLKTITKLRISYTSFLIEKEVSASVMLRICTEPRLSYGIPRNSASGSTLRHILSELTSPCSKIVSAFFYKPFGLPQSWDPLCPVEAQTPGPGLPLLRRKSRCPVVTLSAEQLVLWPPASNGPLASLPPRMGSGLVLTGLLGSRILFLFIVQEKWIVSRQGK